MIKGFTKRMLSIPLVLKLLPESNNFFSNWFLLYTNEIELFL